MASQATAKSISVSAIILTLDEEVNIARCLASLERIDEVILVDSGSTDRTRAIAQEVRPDLRLFTHEFLDFGNQRNWAIDHTAPRHEWILFVDADEFCTPELLNEIDAFVREPGNHVGAFVAGKTYFLGRWLKHAAMYPSYQLRLLRSGEVRFRKEGHGQREVTAGTLYYLKESWTHHPFRKGVNQWITRHNHYSTEEFESVQKLRAENFQWSRLFSTDAIKQRRVLRQLAAKAPFRPALRFLFVYIWKRGFIDGNAGLIYSALLMAHNINIIAKLAEYEYLKRAKSNEQSD